MAQLTLPSRQLYVLSGVPGAGKSTFIKSNGLEKFTISSDRLREEIVGVKYNVEDDVIVKDLHSSQDTRVFSVIKTMLESRMHEHLTTFLDLTSVDESTRSEYAKIASSFGMETTVLIFNEDIDECLRRNSARESRVPAAVIRELHARFVPDSVLPHKMVSSSDKVLLTYNEIVDTKLDVIGDVHGLIHNLRNLVKKLGYEENSDGIFHPDDRKILLLGDFVDRGQDSLDVVRWVMKAVKSGHYAIMGNHEKKIIRFWNTRNEKDVAVRISTSSAETADALMRIDPAESASMISFLSKLPDYYVIEKEKIAFCHANVDSFHPELTPASELNYGVAKRLQGVPNSDARYYSSWKKRDKDPRLNQYQVVRGHITSMDDNDAIFSLEDNQAFAGRLVAMRMDKFIKHGKDIKAFKKSVVYEKCTFDYREFSKTQRALERAMQDLINKKLVIAQKDPFTGLMLFKYSRAVFYNRLWDVHPALIKARGLVMDMSGNIVQHPFDKVFNFREGGAGLQVHQNAMVEYVNKMNGFLASVTKHPYVKNQLLITTTGSFNSAYVDLAKKSLSEYGLSKVFKALSGQDISLMFEIISKEDPHVIQYADEDHKPWLIGVRGHGFTDKCWLESEVDELASTFNFARPSRGIMPMKDVIDANKSSTGEGVMIRDLNGEYICKLKSPLYLTTKFVGRMVDSNIRHMFNSPENFKKGLDEEFYYVVDALVSSMHVDEYISMQSTDRIKLIHHIAEECTSSETSYELY